MVNYARFWPLPIRIEPVASDRDRMLVSAGFGGGRLTWLGLGGVREGRWDLTGWGGALNCVPTGGGRPCGWRLWKTRNLDNPNSRGEFRFPVRPGS